MNNEHWSTQYFFVCSFRKGEEGSISNCLHTIRIKQSHKGHVLLTRELILFYDYGFSFPPPRSELWLCCNTLLTLAAKC